MKKSLILFGLLTLCSNLFSIDEQANTPKSTTPKQQLSRRDKIKAGAALFGCALCTWATLFSHSAKKYDIIT